MKLFQNDPLGLIIILSSPLSLFSIPSFTVSFTIFAFPPLHRKEEEVFNLFVCLVCYNRIGNVLLSSFTQVCYLGRELRRGMERKGNPIKTVLIIQLYQNNYLSNLSSLSFSLSLSRWILPGSSAHNTTTGFLFGRVHDVVMEPMALALLVLGLPNLEKGKEKKWWWWFLVKETRWWWRLIESKISILVFFVFMSTLLISYSHRLDISVVLSSSRECN